MSLLATLRAKKQNREVATLTVAAGATHQGQGVPSVARVATVTVASSETQRIEGSNNPTRKAGHSGELTFEAPAANDGVVPDLAPATDPDFWCWPNSSAMNSWEIDTFTARLARFAEKGVSNADAERLADVLVQRDREGDDRRLCLECACLRGSGRWSCSNWRQALVGQQGLAHDLILMLQRCEGYRCGIGSKQIAK